MIRSCSRRIWLQMALTTWLLPQVSGCGTLLHPERRGQPAGRLDWGVVLLDGIGLLFFFIPGVIAFAVDFLNGTIYLPPDCVDCEPPVTSKDKPQLRKVKVSRRDLNPAGIEEIIARETHKTISLTDERCVTCPMETIDEFWEARGSLAGHSLGRLPS